MRTELKRCIQTSRGAGIETRSSVVMACQFKYISSSFFPLYADRRDYTLSICRDAVISNYSPTFCNLCMICTCRCEFNISYI